MARSYAQIYLTIWNDPDFRDLSRDAQWLYFIMLTHPSLTSCGVMEWREAHLIKRSNNTSVEDLQNAAWELGKKRLIAVDPETEEALIRSFVRHDGILKSPNKTKALVREHASIASLKLMKLVSVETRRALAEDPELRGAKEAEPVAKQFPDLDGKGLEMVPERFRKGSESVPFSGGSKSGKGSDLASPPSSLIPKPLSNDKSEGAGKPGPKRASRLPESWEPTQAHRERAAENRLDINVEIEKFKNYQEEKGGTSKNWNASFTRWLINASEFRRERNPVRNSFDDIAAMGERMQAQVEGRQ